MLLLNPTRANDTLTLEKGLRAFLCLGPWEEKKYLPFLWFPVTLAQWYSK